MTREQIEQSYLQLKRQLFDKFYDFLNPEQREAVYTAEGPLLILAGAGSGKTTVLTNRIGHLIAFGTGAESEYVPYNVGEETLAEMESYLSRSRGELYDYLLANCSSHACDAYRILAFTFTNKAAKEIKERLIKVVGQENADQIMSGTFHNVCTRILHRYGSLRGYKSDFAIYDEDAKMRALKEAIKRLGYNDKIVEPKAIAKVISSAKDRLLAPDNLFYELDGESNPNRIVSIYKEYQTFLKENNALDFDDIIMETVLLLQENKDVREFYQKRYQYVLVDEYQDTNHAQFELCRLLSDGYKNIMVVGDDDQSIYRFRGADITNILSFDKNYPNAKVIRLEQNYRSTSNILDAANAVIKNNDGRKGKELWTNSPAGDKLLLVKVNNENAEARSIVEKVLHGVANEGYTYKDYAILMRKNSQSRALEEAFIKSGVPYRLLGGTKFYDREEIRDVLAYMQFLNNKNDEVRLFRIFNVPARGLGDKAETLIKDIAVAKGISAFEVMQHAEDYVALGRVKDKILAFVNLINELDDLSKTESLPVFYELMLQKTGYKEMWKEKAEKDIKALDKIDNIDEFLSTIRNYSNEAENPTLSEFLEEIALISDVDKYDENADASVIMTMHSAKGLEFPVVFLPAMEEGSFPSPMAVEEPHGLEEERRLMYVAITRAKKKLYLFLADSRDQFGHTVSCLQPSRFIREIPASLLQEKDESTLVKRPPFAGFGQSRYDDNKFSWNGGYGYTNPNRDTHYREEDRQYATPDNSYKPKINSSIETITVGQKPNFQVAKEIFQEGDRVKHATFGEGTVISVKTMANDRLYEIIFDSVGTKKLMGNYARLQRV